jgi:hypothetical protein
MIFILIILMITSLDSPDTLIVALRQSLIYFMERLSMAIALATKGLSDQGMYSG